MRNKETGEFELIVGNGVLLSGFFIVVLLFAVAFAMGFIVARAKYQQEPQSVAAASSAVPLSPPVTSSRPAESAMPPADSPRPAVDPPASSVAKPPETSAPTTQPVASDAPPGASADPNTVQEAPTGHYWQVTSTADIQAARVYLQTIKDMGLPVTLSPGPNRLTRVLVGPFPDSAALAKAKTQLNNAGMQTVRHDQQ